MNNVELHRYPVGHFDVYTGTLFEAISAVETEFLQPPPDWRFFDERRPRVMTSWKSKTRRAAAYSWAVRDARRAAKAGRAGIEQRQRDRVQKLLAFVRAHSPYLADLYRDLPSPLSDISQLPAVTKAQMMSHFDDWVTDPDVTQADVEAFIADPGLVGHDYRGRYVVCTTSGATGTPAILMHDQRALMIYNVLGYVRSLPVSLLSPANVWALVRGRGRLAAVFVTGGHFLGSTMMARRHRTMPWRAEHAAALLRDRPHWTNW